MEGLAPLRKQTTKFIQENPSEVILNRPTVTGDGAGGSTTVSAPVASQTMRVIRRKQGDSVELRSVSGELLQPDLVLIGEWNADVEVDDEFEWDAVDYSVIWINDMGYEKMIDVMGRG